VKKSWFIHIYYGVALVTVLIASVIVIQMIFKRAETYEQQLNERDAMIVELSGRWDNLGPAAEGLVVASGLRAGQELRADNWMDFLTVVTHPANLNLHTVTPADFQVPKFVRASMREGTMLTADDILDTRLSDTMRFIDIILDEIPVGLLPGHYIDIRIRFPFGQDFVALPFRRVEQINGPVLKIMGSEQDILTYNSMLTDKVLYQAQLYAAMYVDPGAQQAADAFYPLNNNIHELLQRNPNALDIVREEMRVSRELLEAEMLDVIPADQDLRELHFLSLQQELASLRSQQSGAISGQQTLFTQRWEAEQRMAAGTQGNEGAGRLDWTQMGPVR
jgi:hypothetical protein